MFEKESALAESARRKRAPKALSKPDMKRSSVCYVRESVVCSEECLVFFFCSYENFSKIFAKKKKKKKKKKKL